MQERTVRTSFSHLKIEVATIGSCASALRPLPLGLRSRGWSCCGSALRAQLWPGPCRATFARTSCNFAAGALANFKLELRERTFCAYNLQLHNRTSGSALHVLFLETCEFSRVGAAGVHFAYYFGTNISHPRPWKCSSRTTFVLKTCGFSAGAAGRTTFVLTICDFAAVSGNALRSQSASTRRVCAKGSLREQDKFARRHSKIASTRTISAKVRREQDAFARRHGKSSSTRRISAQGSPSSRQICTAPQRDHFHTHDLRKGFTSVSQRLQLSETLRLPQNSHSLFMKMLRLPRSL